MQQDPTGKAAPAGGFANGGWYSGYQYVNGSFAPQAGMIHPQSGQQGAGQQVSSQVVAQTNPNNVAYLQNQGGGQPSNNNPAGGNGSTGGTGGAAMPSQPQIPNLAGLYDQHYTNNPDVLATQQRITGFQQQLTARQQALDMATRNINDNPFYAEATRVGKVAKLNNEAQNDMNTLNQSMQTEQTNLSNYQAEAQRQVNLAQGQYTLNNDAWKQNLDEFNTLISQGGLQNANPQTLANLSISTGIPSDMLNSIAQSQQAKNTQVITSTDNSGNVTITAVNSQTGKVVDSTTLAGIGSAKVGRGGNGKGKGTEKVDENGLTKDDYVSYLYNDIANGVSLKSLVQHYQQKIPVANIYSTYASNSPKGAPKETLAQVKSGQFASDKGFVSKAKPNYN